MMNLRYEVYEDNAGGLTMFVLDGEHAIWAHSGYEFTPENLKQDIENLENTKDTDELLYFWDGNGVYTGAEFKDWKNTKMGWNPGAYEDISKDDFCELVADSDGIYSQNMGASALQAFGTNEE